MRKSIQTDIGVFHYNELELFLGRKKLNLQVSKENLILFNLIVRNTDIRYGLFFGTLLGAIRDEGLIPHDEDIDVYVLEEDKQKFLTLLPVFKSHGLDLVRVEEGYVSLMRKNDYIDIYFFKKKKKYFGKNQRQCGKKYLVDEEHFINTKYLNLFGQLFPVPNQPEKLLKKIYGMNWQTPIEGHHAKGNTLIYKAHSVLVKLGLSQEIINIVKNIIKKV